jgi:RING-type zinc-finger
LRERVALGTGGPSVILVYVVLGSDASRWRHLTLHGHRQPQSAHPTFNITNIPGNTILHPQSDRNLPQNLTGRQIRSNSPSLDHIVVIRLSAWNSRVRLFSICQCPSTMEEEYLDTDTFTFSATQGFPGHINSLFPNSADSEEHMLPAHISTQLRPTQAPISSFINSFDLHTPTVPDDVDLRALDYVDPPNENLICAICASAFVTPMELGCGHIFCKECLYDHLQSGIQSANRCPKCRREAEGVSPVSTILAHLLDELEVECPNRTLGCDLHIKRYTIRNHVKQYCPFTEIPCSSPDCELFIERRYAKEDSCLHSYLECEDCLDQIMEKDMHVSLPLILYPRLFQMLQQNG